MSQFEEILMPNPEFQMAHDAAEKAISNIFSAYKEEENRILEGFIRELANPKIKGEITAGKLRWRGISIAIYPDFSKAIFQRGERISPIILPPNFQSQ